MCDTLCAIRPAGALFAKNSDRPLREVQLIEAHARRSGGSPLRTQYLTLDDPGAHALLGSRPDWLWGFEHGVNERRVAIGNEKVYTSGDPFAEPAALIGMDLVRLGVERGGTADEALEAMTVALERHGQGGVADQTTNEPYFSSFLIADPRSGWILETAGRTWVAAPVIGVAAISNRLSIRTEWTRSSADVPPGADWDAWRNQAAPTGYADVRLDASRACLAATPAEALKPADLAAHLRSHEDGPWARPGDPAGAVSPIPVQANPVSGTGITVCMHVAGFQSTTSSMVAELPADPGAPLRAWVAPASPCASIYVPVFPPHAGPAALGDPAVWARFASLRDYAWQSAEALAEVRAAFAPLEAELWAEADDVAPNADKHVAFVESAWRRVEGVLGRLESLTAAA